MSTAASTRSTTSTLTRVAYLAQKVRTDLIQVLDHYRYYDTAYMEKVIADIKVFLDEEVVEEIKLTWKDPLSSRVLEEVRYSVIAGTDSGLTDARPGGIRYKASLVGASFHTIVRYNQRWRGFDEEEKGGVRELLTLRWTTAPHLDYEGGSFSTDRSYYKDGMGLQRGRFTR